MKYYTFTEFTAQSRLVSALMGMYANLEKTPVNIKTEFTPFAVFMAFSVEAYLNSIGFRVVPFWKSVERNKWKEKIEILHSVSEKNTNWGEDPLQFISELFKIRDKLAHGKPETVKSDPYNTQVEVEKASLSHDEQPDWYKKLDREWVLKAKDKFRIAMQYFSSLHDLHESDHLSHSSGGIMIDDEKD